MKLSLLFWFFQTFPESLALSSMAIVVGGHRLETRSVFLIGVMIAVAVYLIRLIPITFGVHFVLLVIILAVLLNILFKDPISRCLLTALVAGLILAVSETILISLMSLATAVPMEQVTENSPMHIIYAWPHIVFMFFLVLFINRWRRGRRESLEKEKDV